MSEMAQRVIRILCTGLLLGTGLVAAGTGLCLLGFALWCLFCGDK